MTVVVPARYLFRWAFPVPRRDTLPAENGPLLDLSEAHRCLPLSQLDGGPDFAEFRLAWNDHGLGMTVIVRGKQDPLICQTLSPQTSDGVTIWLDTRSTQNVHRATRYCHQFCLLPTGSGKKKEQPSITSISLVRRGDEGTTSARPDDSPIRLWSEIRDDGYTLEAWWPAAALAGFDPEAHRQLGFYAVVRDAELGEQYLTVGREFPFEHDPSLWQTLDLVD